MFLLKQILSMQMIYTDDLGQNRAGEGRGGQGIKSALSSLFLACLIMLTQRRDMRNLLK